MAADSRSAPLLCRDALSEGDRSQVVDGAVNPFVTLPIMSSSPNGSRKMPIWVMLVLVSLPVIFVFASTIELSKVDWTKVDWGSIVFAFAAAVQAVSATIIVWLTVNLARTATQALETSRAQVDVAERSVRLQRRDMQVATAPVVEMGRPVIYEEPTIGTMIEVEFHNRSDTPALGLTIGISAADERHVPLGDDRIKRSAGTIGPGDRIPLAIEMKEFKNIPNPQFPGRSTTVPFSDNWMAIHLAYRGILGQKVYRDYWWSANFEKQGQDGVWLPLGLVVDPDVPDGEVAHIDF